MTGRLIKLLGIVLLSGLLFSPVANAEGRSKEVGVLDYFSKYSGGTSYQLKAVKELYQVVEETGISPEWVDVDIFLPDNRAKRDDYKRICIPSPAYWFTPKMLEGMEDYVKSGGLLVTNSSLSILDKDDSYDVNSKNVVSTRIPAQRFLGVYGQKGCTIKKIKIQPEMECPLTKGLEKGTWLDLQMPMAGRVTRNVSAEKVIVSDCVQKEKVSAEQPFLTFKHLDNGACIYLVGQIRMPLKSMNDKNMVQIIRNILSSETLEWLCGGD
ncbi:MAG: hypothetical protein PHT33_05785 [bacterium]|nr:hypothetical protein [bacterium]